MDGIFSMRDKIIMLIKEDYPKANEEKMRNILSKASNDDVERVLDSFYRFGAKVIMENIN